jgi:hypothetical protein
MATRSVSTVTAKIWTERGICVALAVAGGTASAHAGAQPSAEAPVHEATAVQGPSPLVVEVVDLPAAQVLDELRLRLPAREITMHDAPRPEPPLSYAIVRRDPAGLRMTLITPGGAAYDRDVQDVPDQSVRAAAGALATMIDSVESGRVAPTRTEVPIPPPPEPKPEPEPEPAPNLATEPEPPTRVPAPIHAPEPAEDPPPAAELALTLSPGVALGLAPRTDAPALLGGGGSLGIDVRMRSGAMAVVDARGLGRTSEGLGLVRMRIAAGGGYAWRRGAFELPIAAFVSVEPWWLRRNRSAAPLLREGSSQSERPLIGGGLRIAPGLFVARHRAHLPSVRVGARAELSGSFVSDAGARTAEILVEDSAGATTSAARLGGLELWLGLDVAIWFPIL